MARLISISFVVLDWSPARPLGVMGLTVTPSAGSCLTVTGLGLCYVPAKNIPEILLGFSFAVFSTTIQDVWVIGRLGGWLFGLLVAWLFGSWPQGGPGRARSSSSSSSVVVVVFVVVFVVVVVVVVVIVVVVAAADDAAAAVGRRRVRCRRVRRRRRLRRRRR